MNWGKKLYSGDEGVKFWSASTPIHGTCGKRCRNPYRLEATLPSRSGEWTTAQTKGSNYVCPAEIMCCKLAVQSGGL